MVLTIEAGISIFTHCSGKFLLYMLSVDLCSDHDSLALDGWDRTSQLTALAMLCLDPYYRTMEGNKSACALLEAIE